MKSEGRGTEIRKKAEDRNPIDDAPWSIFSVFDTEAHFCNGVLLVSDDMQSDYGENRARGQRGGGDQNRGQVGPNGRDGLPNKQSQVAILCPSPPQCNGAGEQDSTGQPDEQDPQTQARSGSVPIDNTLGGVCGLILDGLHVTCKERGHEE